MAKNVAVGKRIALALSLGALTLGVGLIFPSVTPAVAQDGKPYEIVGSKTYHMVARGNQKTYEIQIAAPAGFNPDMCDDMVTLYQTDGNWAFSGIVDAAKFLQFEKQIPPVLVVGIGYPTDGFQIALTRRLEDLLPVPVKPNPGETASPENTDESGKAEAFVAFIRDQVMPFVEQTYCPTEERVYSGYSYGGTFGTYVLFKHSELFTRFMIGGPDYSENNKVFFEYEQVYSKNHSDLDKRIYMSVGSEENDETIPGMFKMVFAMKNRGYPNMELKFHMVEGETHISHLLTFNGPALRWLLSDLGAANSDQ